MNDNHELVCTRCGSPLIEISQTVHQSVNPLYPITITRYRCTNSACQEEADNKQAELAKRRLEREEKSESKQQLKLSGKS